MAEENIPHPHMGHDLVGHERAEQMFLDAHNSGRLHHAWLITGPRGIGKASLAFKMARFLLHNPPQDNASLFGDAQEKAAASSLDTDPESSINTVITAGGHGDLITMERRPDEKTGKMKAEIGVKDVRRVQNFFAKTSTEGGWRIVIVDCADEMTISAENALLKSLEEPPKNALLILVAHAPGKLLPTVISRCRQLRLNPLSNQSVGDILARRYPELAEDELASYAILSDGSPGYAITLAEHHGLELYIQLLEILASLPKLDVPLAHKIADSLAPKKADQQYALFGELLTSFLNRMIRHVAATGQGQGAEESPVKPALTGELELMAHLGRRIALDQWVDLWEKISHKMGQINLDRKQVILNVLTLLSHRLT